MSNSIFYHWLSAARPQTLTAALVPVLTGASLAYSDQLLRWDTTLVALFCAFAIQIGTNFANDYFDHIKGADTDERIGFQRATASGQISPGAMLNAALISMLIAFFAGLYLVWIAGWVILLIGLLSLLFGILYTGGPYPLGYNGLGDLFVFIFFGVIAVAGTYYVNAFQVTEAAIWASIPVGALCVNILVVNNLRDIDQDRAAEKRTLGVLFGEHALRLEYLAMFFVAFAMPLVLYYRLSFSIWILLPFLSLPVAWHLVKKVWYFDDRRELNNTLKQTAIYMLIFGILFSSGMLM